MKKYLKLDWPILSGSISTAKSQCGQAGCICKKNPPQLHGTYYRWTGFMNGKRTTKTITKEVASECKKRIANLRKLQKEINNLINKSHSDPPWKSDRYQNWKRKTK
jgi:hypothetical protein